MNRRYFLATGGLSALHLFVAGCRSRSMSPLEESPAPDFKVAPVPIPHVVGFGPLTDHPTLPFALPAGFQVTLLQRIGDPMSDGHRMPGQPDGMACFALPTGEWVLLRNHELAGLRSLSEWSAGEKSPFKDGTPPAPYFSEKVYGGVSRIVVDPNRLNDILSENKTIGSDAISRSHMVLSGTDSNCAGGVVDNAWISCEESGSPGHGYAFVTRPEQEELMPPEPIESWGRLYREAVAIDPSSGIVYMTEDRRDGCFYRFLPEDPKAPFGPGRLQALRIPNIPNTSPYTSADTAPKWDDGTSWDVEWIDVPDRSAKRKSCRAQSIALGATTFYRGEGISADHQGIWFIASTGGQKKGGQIFRYIPETQQLELALEIQDRSLLSCPDNLCVSPWDHLILSEDNYGFAEGVTNQYVRGMTRDGQVYDIVRGNHTLPNHPGPEFTGACFSPDGTILFVNVQSPLEWTLAIKGPWPTQAAG